MFEVLRTAVTVTTPLGLLGLVTALGYLIYARKLKHREKQLSGLPPDERAKLVDDYLSRYGIDGKDLKSGERLELIRDEMGQRHRRALFYVTMASLVFVVCFGIAALSYWKAPVLPMQADHTEEIKRLDSEIAFRLRDIPHVLQLARSYTNAIPKANVLSDVFRLPEADWPPSLLPEYNKRSAISLCYDLKTLSKGSDQKSAEAAYAVFEKMAKACRENYYVHDMMKMTPDRLAAAENEAQGYFEELIRIRPEWKPR